MPSRAIHRQSCVATMTRRRSTEVTRRITDVRVAGDQVIEHLPTGILYEEVGEVVVRLRAAHLAEVDHAGVEAVALIDVGRVEVAVGEAARRSLSTGPSERRL